MATGREPAKRVIQQVRPLLSVSKDEARRRVLNLYKAWVRQLPNIGIHCLKMKSFPIFFSKHY